MLLTTFCKGQQKDQSLIGAMCPDFNLVNIINSPKGISKVSDFKGKLLILDFWATWCSPCVSSFPKMQQLQKEFSDKLFILSVTDQPTDLVSKFLKNMKDVTGVQPVSVTADRELTGYFKPKLIPHYVWINSDGYIIAITDMDAVNKEHIQLALDNKSFTTTDIESRLPYNSSTPAFIVAKAYEEGRHPALRVLSNDDVLYHSTLTKYMKGFGGYSSFDSTRITKINATVPALFNDAFGHGLSGANNSWTLMFSRKRIVWEVRDSALNYLKLEAFAGIKDNKRINELMQRSTYCYELTIPPSEAKHTDKFALMREDLNRYFGSKFNISAKVEKRTVKCLAFQLLDKNVKPNSKGGTETTSDNAFLFAMNNYRFSWFISRMATYYLQYEKLPVIDETGLGMGKIDLNIQCKLTDMAALNKELRKNGLQLAEVTRDLEMIVIKDKPVK